MAKEKLICGLNPDEIEALKSEHGALVLVTVGFEDQSHQVIFKEPTILQLEAVEKIGKNAPVRAMQTAYVNYKVIADEEIEKRDMLKIKAVETLIARMQKTRGEAKNL